MRSISRNCKRRKKWAYQILKYATYAYEQFRAKTELSEVVERNEKC